MWISRKFAAAGSGDAVSALAGPVTIGGEKAAVLLSGEARELHVVAPGGIAWTPEADTQALVLETGDGERFILGTVQQGGSDDELTLRCGGAQLRLCRNGSVMVEGRLFLNGAELTAGIGEE